MHRFLPWAIYAIYWGREDGEEQVVGGLADKLGRESNVPFLYMLKMDIRNNCLRSIVH